EDRQCVARPLELFLVADAIVEVLPYERSADAEQQPEEEREGAGPQRSGLDRRGRQRRGSDDAGATRRESEPDLEPVRRLPDPRLFAEQRAAPLAQRVLLVGGRVPGLLVERIDLLLQAVDLILDLLRRREQLVDPLRALRVDVRVRVGVRDPLSA